MPTSEDHQEGSVRIVPAQPKAPAADAAPGRDGGETGGASGGKDMPASGLTEGGTTFESLPAGGAAATEPNPVKPPDPLPHFDRPRSTPTPPQDTGNDQE
jgi:hypothetical protein